MISEKFGCLIANVNVNAGIHHAFEYVVTALHRLIGRCGIVATPILLKNGDGNRRYRIPAYIPSGKVKGKGFTNWGKSTGQKFGTDLGARHAARGMF